MVARVYQSPDSPREPLKADADGPIRMDGDTRGGWNR